MTKYSTEIVSTPTWQAIISCPKCGSHNTRVFPDVHFMADDFPKKESNFIYVQGQCNDCEVLLLIGVRQYMMDVTVTEPNPPKEVHGNFTLKDETQETVITEYGRMSFAGTCVDVGGESDEDDEPLPKGKSPNVTLVEEGAD